MGTVRLFENKIVTQSQWLAIINCVRAGDVVVVPSIDRLASSLADLETRITQINNKGCTVEFRQESLIFSGGEDLMRSLNRATRAKGK